MRATMLATLAALVASAAATSAADEDPAFPVCDCGRRVYCGEACQAQDWAAGHSTQHAFLASFLGEDLDEEVRTILRRWAKTSMKRCGR